MPIPVAETRETSSLLSRGLRRVFSFPAAIAGVLCALAVLTARDRFNDPDMWWHLKTGQFIWTTGSLPTVDPYSFTALGQRWTPHEWLSQLALYGTYRLGGYSGMMAAFCCLSAALLVAGYALCAMYSRNVKVAFIGAFVLFLFATSGFSIRPQLLGYLLLIVEMDCSPPRTLPQSALVSRAAATLCPVGQLPRIVLSGVDRCRYAASQLVLPL